MNLKSPEERLRHARKQANFATAVAAAAALGLSDRTYTQHENGTRKFTRDDAVRYAEFFGVSVNWLLTGKGPMKPKGADPLVEKVRSLPPDLREEVHNFIEFRTSPRK